MTDYRDISDSQRQSVTQHASTKPFFTEENKRKTLLYKLALYVTGRYRVISAQFGR
jgi:hypothetical protein